MRQFFVLDFILRLAVITKLPRWVEFSTCLLAILAGIVNAIGLMGFQHQAVSHLSGTVTLLGSSLATILPSSISASSMDSYTNIPAFHLLMIIISFAAGAIFSGILFEDTALKLGRRYGVALCIEGSLLFLAWYDLAQGSVVGQYFASAACGLQNAMVTSFSGAVIRTTHMTGIVTDLGIMIGAWLRGKAFNHRKAKLLLLTVLGFTVGGALGAFFYQQWAINALIIPAVFSFMLAICYWIFIYHIRRPKNISEESIS